ncbi:MAG TPA: ParB N-terminal domain-containing protein [Candidatus Bathyarchaeia archaeon]|nr:ParB N-terminal domain-containing protein [Candidatus Bathyarchaeia archaeon]
MDEEKRQFIYVEARKIHGSLSLPSREYDPKLVELIKKQGIQQPIIVRPSPFSPNIGSCDYEAIDGHLRLKAAEKNQLVLVDLRLDVGDIEVFKISEDTFKRKRRSVFERALFYSSWARMVGLQLGVEGAQRKVALDSGLSEAAISYYVSIGDFFRELYGKVSDPVLNALKIQSVNKLYELCKVDNQDVRIKVAGRMADSPDMTLKELRVIIQQEVEATSPLELLMRDDEETERKQEEARMSQLRETAKQLESLFEVTGKAVSSLKANVDSNPRVFLSPEVFRKIQRMLGALKRIENEANRLVNLRVS